MRYTLKDYQDEAVADVLERLARARDSWHRWKSPVAFSLTATTGAGKTVMAAAVIEALFDGKSAYDFEADPGAVVLWFTDDPSLNEQTRFRLRAAADRILPSRLVVIENTFNREKLEPGRVYFLNAQKLGKNSLLVRGAPRRSGAKAQYDMPMPDARAFTMWDTLANTITDEKLSLYVILDEAHRGMKTPTKGDRAEKATIVQRLVNGSHGVPPVPIVWGISATVERFNKAMDKAENRTNYPSVVVDPASVQESGLLKDDIRLDFPTDTGRFDSVLLARATRKARHVTELWSAYARREGAAADLVVPLLVVQVPNTPSEKLLRLAFTTIQDTWPELEPDAMAHVFGNHAPIELGGFRVPHIRPETVQERTHVRVLFAKDAISTGWDCPRAEVLVSFRPAQDDTHITQLLGRMVRTPLARRVPGNDLLNSVECVLPHFNRRTAARVAKTMLGDRVRDDDGTGGGDGRRVLFNPVDMDVNQAIPAVVWDVFDALPSQTLPRKAARPVRRLTALAQALSRDGLRKGALKDAYRKLFARLDGLLAQHKADVASNSEGVLRVEGETLVVRVVGGELRERRTFVETADEYSVETRFKVACRSLTADIARKYADHLARANGGDDDLFDAHVKIAALSKVDGVADELDREADQLARKWFDKYRVPIMDLTDERRTLYDEITGMSPEPQVVELKRPRVRTEETENADGTRRETRARHLMADENGDFPIDPLNQWETDVIDREMSHPRFQAWYRNPSRPSSDTLVVAYRNAQDHWRRICPDFIFFHGDKEKTRASIVDPHGHHFADALPKLKGLAEFAAKHADRFHRVESVSRMKDGTLRVLALQEPRVRAAVQEAEDAESAYLSDWANDY